MSVDRSARTACSGGMWWDRSPGVTALAMRSRPDLEGARAVEERPDVERQRRWRSW